MHSLVFRDVARFIALGVFLALSVNQWVRVKRSPKRQRWGTIAVAILVSCLTIVTILDIILDL
jgi:hypothetical protein